MLAEPPNQRLWIQLLALRWPVALASAAVLPLALPLPGNPVTLAGFVALIGGCALISSLRWLIVSLPVLAALGQYFLPMVVGVNLFGFRLLIIILLVFSTPLTSRSEWWFNPVARYTVLFMILWTVYGLLSLLWTPDQVGGIIEVLTIFFGTGLVLVIFNLKCYALKNLDMLRFGWIFAVVVVMAQATWELITGDRLPSTMTEKHEAYLDSSVVQATLGSPTAFGGFLLLATPFLLWSMERARGAEKLLYIGFLAASSFWILYSASRLSFMGLVLQFLLYFLVLERRWYVRSAAVACGLAATMLWTNVFLQSGFMLARKVENAAASGYVDSSIEERLKLSLNGLWMAVETAGRGVGADGFEETVEGGDVLIQLDVINRGRWKPAHNVWVEILSEYGVVPFVGLIALLGWIASLGWQAGRWTRGGQAADRGAVGRAVLVGLVGYVIYGVGSGSVMAQSINFMFFASLSALAAFLYDAKRPRQQLPDATAGVPRNSPARSGPRAGAPRLTRGRLGGGLLEERNAARASSENRAPPSTAEAPAEPRAKAAFNILAKRAAR